MILLDRVNSIRVVTIQAKQGGLPEIALCVARRSGGSMMASHTRESARQKPNVRCATLLLLFEGRMFPVRADGTVHGVSLFGSSLTLVLDVDPHLVRFMKGEGDFPVHASDMGI